MDSGAAGARATTLDRERRGPVAVLTFARPEVLNAMDQELLDAVTGGIREDGNDPEVRAMVLTGAGRAFMAGADVRMMAAATPAEFRHFTEGIQELTRVIRAVPVPVIAAVNGLAVGAGCEIACACDLRVAAAQASFTFPEVRIGLVVTSGASWLLPRLVGRGWARRLILTGERIDANAALAIGLVEAVADGSALDAAVDVGRAIAAGERTAVALSKRLLDIGEEGGLEPILRAEVESILSCISEGQAREGLTAFVEKREPRYRTGDEP